MKFTVTKVGWGIEEEDFDTMAVYGGISRKDISELLDKNVFFSGERGAKTEGTPVKRKVKITVEINDVKPSREKK